MAALHRICDKFAQAHKADRCRRHVARQGISKPTDAVVECGCRSLQGPLVRGLVEGSGMKFRLTVKSVQMRQDASGSRYVTVHICLSSYHSTVSTRADFVALL